MDDIVVVRGAGDLATGIAHRLHRCGFRLLMTEVKEPLVVRRKVAFANAVMEGAMELEGVKAVKAIDYESILEIWEDNSIPVLCDEECRIIEKIKPMAVVDAIMAKRNIGTARGMAPITLGIGPGFEAGIDVDAVVETNRGHNLGKVIYQGSAEADTGIPGSIAGFSKERLLRAPANGRIRNILDIGHMVKQGDVVALVDDVPVKASVPGVIRGLICNNNQVLEGMKIGDVDPRGIREFCYTISDKARSVAGGVLEALLYLRREKLGK